MNPHDILIADHQTLRTQAGSLRTSVDKNPKHLESALLNFQQTVQKHFKREDIYYRVLDDGKRVDDRGLVHQLRNDHAAVVFTMESLVIRLRKNGVNPEWRTRFENLMNVFIPHLDQEEKQLFPIGQKMLSPQEIQTLTEQMRGDE